MESTVDKHDPRIMAVINTLFAYQYVNATTNPLILGSIIKSVLLSSHDLGRITNATGLSPPIVKNIISSIYACINRASYLGGNPMVTCLQIKDSTLNSIEYCMDLRSNTNALVLLVVGIFSCGFLFTASFINRRRSSCINSCYGRPAPVVPLNMLDSYENRFGNALAFGVTTSYCLHVLFGSSKNVLGTYVGNALEKVPSSVSLIFKVIATIVISNAAYPLFVCMRTKYKGIGSLFGIFYSSAWLLLLVLKFYLTYRGCLSKLAAKSEILEICEILLEIPQCLCILLLLMRFIMILVKHMKVHPKVWRERGDKLVDEFQEEYLIIHVENLLKAVKRKRTRVKASLKGKITEKMYTWKPEFRYSTRVISAFMVSGITIYIVAVQLLLLVWHLDLFLQDFVATDNFQSTIQNVFPNDRALLAKIRKHLDIWIICLYVSIGLAALKTFVVFLNMLSWYRGHITRLRKGDQSWLPASMKSLKESSSSLMAAGMKYAGFQVAYIAWGFIVFACLLLIILGMIASFIIYPLIHGESSFLLKLILQGLPTIALSLVVYLFQILSAKFVFLQNKDTGIAVNNRNAFHITSYYMFFFNIFLGLFSCLMRIIKGLIIGVIFLERVQKSLLPRSFEKMDPGYFAYVGYILVEHSHANPVLCVFLQLMKEEFINVKRNRKSIAILLSEEIEPSNGIKSFTTTESIQFELEKRTSQFLVAHERRKIIRNKWNLLYTLVNNPDLVKYRKHELNVEEEDECEDVDYDNKGQSSFYD